MTPSPETLPVCLRRALGCRGVVWPKALARRRASSSAACRRGCCTRRYRACIEEGAISLRPMHRLKCWGENAFGELGDGTTKASDVPVRVGELIPPNEPPPVPIAPETPRIAETPHSGSSPASGTPSSSSGNSSVQKTPRRRATQPTALTAESAQRIDSR